MDQYALTAIAEAAASGTLEARELRKFIDPVSHDQMKEMEAATQKLANENAELQGFNLLLAQEKAELLQQLSEANAPSGANRAEG